MGREFQNAIDRDNLEEARDNLNEFTDKIHRKGRFYKDIADIDDENIDRIHLDFLCNNPDLSFNEIQIVKKVFDHIKSIKLL